MPKAIGPSAERGSPETVEDADEQRLQGEGGDQAGEIEAEQPGIARPGLGPNW